MLLFLFILYVGVGGLPMSTITTTSRTTVTITACPTTFFTRPKVIEVTKTRTGSVDDVFKNIVHGSVEWWWSTPAVAPESLEYDSTATASTATAGVSSSESTVTASTATSTAVSTLPHSLSFSSVVASLTFLVASSSEPLWESTESSVAESSYGTSDVTSSTTESQSTETTTESTKSTKSTTSTTSNTSVTESTTECTTKSTALFTSSASSSSSISSSSTVSLETADIHPGTTSSTLWGRFWSDGSDKFNANDQNCDTSFSAPSVWEVAVAARAVILSTPENTDKVLANLYSYQNTELGVFSASTAGDTDIYNDDNAQIAWCFIDGYKHTKNQKYLDTAVGIVDFLMKQVDDKGGVIWKYQNDYIASISTIEAALAALRLYEVNWNTDLVAFAKKCVDYMYEYFQDPGDYLFYDGLEKSDYSAVNKGKLSYTVGCSLSVLSLLHKYDDSEDWQSKLLQLGKAATNKQGAFYNGDGIWNNSLKYVHLLFIGFHDILKVSSIDSFREEVTRQANFIATYLQDIDSLFFNSINSCSTDLIDRYDSNFGQTTSKPQLTYCNSIAKKSLIDNGSALQILLHS